MERSIEQKLLWPHLATCTYLCVYTPVKKNVLRLYDIHKFETSILWQYMNISCLDGS